MRRREFIAGLGAAAWPLAVRAQQGDRVRHIGVLMPNDENDPAGNPWLCAFTQALADLGWTDGRKVRMELRWGDSDNNRMRALAAELVGLKPDILTRGHGGRAIHKQTGFLLRVPRYSARETSWLNRRAP
jgi:putative ABC transport system substrate-binding protein